MLPTSNTTVSLAYNETASGWILQISQGLVWIAHNADTCGGSQGPVCPAPYIYASLYSLSPGRTTSLSISQSPQDCSGLRAFALAALCLGWIFSQLALSQHSRSRLEGHILTDAFLNTVPFTSTPLTTHTLYSPATVCLIVLFLTSFLVFLSEFPLQCEFLQDPYWSSSPSWIPVPRTVWMTTWMTEWNEWKSKWLLTCHLLFCFSDLCSRMYSPPQGGALSPRLAQPRGDNIQRLSDEIQRRFSPCSQRAELEHPKWADSWDRWKNRFWWGQALIVSFAGCFICISTGCASYITPEGDVCVWRIGCCFPEMSLL